MGRSRGLDDRFAKAAAWAKNVKAGLPANFHFHDLRYTGNTLAPASGASTRELMHRMGHASMRAALIDQHATSDRDRDTADALIRRIESRRPMWRQSPTVSQPMTTATMERPVPS